MLKRTSKARNIITNGNFADGTTGWVGFGSANLSALNNVLTSIGTGTAVSVTAGASYGPGSVAIYHNRKLYARAKIKVLNANATRVQLQFSCSETAFGIFIVLTPLINTVYTLSSIANVLNTYTGSLLFEVYHRYIDVGTALGKVGEIQEAIVIDLTTLFGAGNEPTAEWCDANFPNWFDGCLSKTSMSQMLK